MQLHLIPVTRKADGTLFAGQDGFNGRWWGPGQPDPARYSYVQVRLDGEEVARVKLDDIVNIDHYADAPRIGHIALQIELLEVSVASPRY